MYALPKISEKNISIFSSLSSKDESKQQTLKVSLCRVHPLQTGFAVCNGSRAVSVGVSPGAGGGNIAALVPLHTAWGKFTVGNIASLVPLHAAWGKCTDGGIAPPASVPWVCCIGQVH